MTDTKYQEGLRKQMKVTTKQSMWRHNGRDESITDKHMKTIELGPPSESFLFEYFTKKNIPI